MYRSYKEFNGYSTAFRQHKADSHCRYIHGYQLKAEVTFACNELDDNNWVFDFGGLKDLKHIYKTQFDHTLVVASDDPEIELLKELNMLVTAFKSLS